MPNVTDWKQGKLLCSETEYFMTKKWSRIAFFKTDIEKEKDNGLKAFNSPPSPSFL